MIRRGEKFKKEALQAEEMRNTSLETFKESQKRDQEGKPKPKKKKEKGKLSSLTGIPKGKSWNRISAKEGGAGVKKARATNGEGGERSWLGFKS